MCKQHLKQLSKLRINYFFCKLLNCSTEQLLKFKMVDFTLPIDIRLGEECFPEENFRDLDKIYLFQFYTQHLNIS